MHNLTIIELEIISVIDMKTFKEGWRIVARYGYGTGEGYRVGPRFDEYEDADETANQLEKKYPLPTPLENIVTFFETPGIIRKTS